MISVENAKELIEQNTEALTVESIKLAKARGRVLAKNVYSKINMPPFRQSAMDGYAVHFSEKFKKYKVIGEVAAGVSGKVDLKAGEAVRIFTGAMVPDSANCVIEQEIVEIEENQISIQNSVNLNRNIRPKGEQITPEEIALDKDEVITPASIGFLAGLGIEEVEVVKKPKITLIVTGNELVSVGNELLPGQIYESNAAMLIAVLNQYGFDEVNMLSIPDDYASTKEQIEEAIATSDFVLLTGGISVGDYDFVGKALKELDIEQLFYKINQKPGKPLYFGKSKKGLVAALPGNPAAALTCFYIYVLPALNRQIGKDFKGLELRKLSLANAYEKKITKGVFLKAKISGDKVQVLSMQSSAMLRTFEIADGLVYVPSNVNCLNENDLVTVYIL